MTHGQRNVNLTYCLSRVLREDDLVKRMSLTGISSHERGEKKDNKTYYCEILHTKPRVHGGNLWKEWRLIFINGGMGEYHWNAS